MEEGAEQHCPRCPPARSVAHLPALPGGLDWSCGAQWTGTIPVLALGLPCPSHALGEGRGLSVSLYLGGQIQQGGHGTEVGVPAAVPGGFQSAGSWQTTARVCGCDCLVREQEKEVSFPQRT